MHWKRGTDQIMIVENDWIKPFDKIKYVGSVIGKGGTYLYNEETVSVGSDQSSSEKAGKYIFT